MTNDVHYQNKTNAEITHTNLRLRLDIRQQRRELTTEQQQQAAQCISQHALALPSLAQANHIGLFLPFDGEINTLPLIQQLWQRKKNVYLPMLHPFSQGHLLFIHYAENTCLIKNQFGIPEPKLDIRKLIPLADLNVLFVPLVVFDHDNNRLGMGGGYYDRTLENYQKYNILPIGLAHDLQRVQHIDTYPWDIPLPIIITPQQIWQKHR